MIAPGFCLEMPTEAKPAMLTAAGIEASPSSQLRIVSVCPDNPPTGVCSVQGRHVNVLTPMHGHAKFRSTVDENLMQYCPANTQTDTMREVCFYCRLTFHEPNAPKGVPLVQPDAHAEVAECRKRIRHQPFAASLVHRRLGSIGHCYAEPFLANGDRGSKAGRSTPHNENV
jgi:hypothetical protein